MIEAGLLNSYVGMSIKDICHNGFTDNSKSHCAHFVSHVLNLDFGHTCGKVDGGNIKVHEIFKKCPQVYEFNTCPSVISGLIFVSQYRNFNKKKQELSNVPKKHIGIIYNGNIWHYSNTRDKVIVQIMAQFIEHYKRQTNALWFGKIPDDARPHPWGMPV